MDLFRRAFSNSLHDGISNEVLSRLTRTFVGTMHVEMSPVIRFDAQTILLR
jgi:hypothetical protein